jgi:hypothetical protein
MVSFAFAGWAVFLAVVASPPDEGDALFLGVGLAASPWWPWNVVALVVAVLSGLGTMLLAVAFGEVALLMRMSDDRQGVPLSVPRAAGKLGMAAVPVVILAAVLLWASAPAFLDAFGHPDPSTPYLVRVVGIAWPALLALAAAASVAQAWGALALRLPWRLVLATLRHRAHRVIPQAMLTMAAFLVVQLLTVVALSAVWQPLSGRLAEGGLSEVSTAILLLGFVWIWLLLVILAGVVQAWISAWWTEELAPRAEQ